MIRKRAYGLVLGTVALVAASSLPLAAQDPATKPSTPAKKKAELNRRVPSYFGQIGLTTEQRATIYGIQARHAEKIDELEKQILAEKAKMMEECEGVLTETQKKLLENLRKAAFEATAKAAEAAAKTGK
jgi:hypothetical protein